MQKISCPECQLTVQFSQAKMHMLTCSKYKLKIVSRIMELVQAYPPSFYTFLSIQLDIAKEKLKNKARDLENKQDNDANLQQRASLVRYQKDESQHVNSIQISNHINNGITQNGSNAKSHTKNQIKDNIIANNTSIQDLLFSRQQQIKKERQQKQKQAQKFRQVQTVNCANCRKSLDANDMSAFVYAYNCLHLFCIECIKSFIQDQYIEQRGSLKCLVKQCKQNIPVEQIKQIIGEQNYDKYESEVLRRTMTFTRCCKCGNQFQFNQGNPEQAPKQIANGAELTKEHCLDFAKNRFVCFNPRCKQEQCRVCKATPYHLGKTCEQNRELINCIRCRYCKQPIKKDYSSHLGIKAFDDICAKKECEKMAKNACSKVLPCKHSCYGYYRQSKCLPCLNQKCSSNIKVPHDQNQSSYCGICYVEGLKAQPCVMSKCGHIFHYSCLQKRLQIRWLTPRMQFNFCHCPLCKEWIELPIDCPLQKILQGHLILKKSVQQKAYNRLKAQKKQNDQKLTDPSSAFFKKPQEYANAIYAYFQCYKCKKPYFGGQKSCAQRMGEQQQNSKDGFDPKILICAACCPVDTTNCPKHGKQFFAFKCRFCCNIGMWFCWGSTHFCDSCHSRQIKGQYVNKIPKDKLPKCEGVGKCPSGGTHPQNGSQYSLGCSVCRHERNDQQE